MQNLLETLAHSYLLDLKKMGQTKQWDAEQRIWKWLTTEQIATTMFPLDNKIAYKDAIREWKQNYNAIAATIREYRRLSKQKPETEAEEMTRRSYQAGRVYRSLEAHLLLECRHIAKNHAREMFTK